MFSIGIILAVSFVKSSRLIHNTGTAGTQTATQSKVTSNVYLFLLKTAYNFTQRLSHY